MPPAPGTTSSEAQRSEPAAHKPAVPEHKTRHLGRGHIPALDGIRGVAILAVVASHLLSGNYAAAGRIGLLFGKFFNLGAKGVDLFFVLSGFLITGILRDSLGEEHYFKKFYARRVLRIFPLYYGVLLLLMLLTVPLAIQWHGSQLSLLLYLQNTSLLPGLAAFGGQRYVNLDHLWSLAVEEQFYLVWPFLVFAIRSPRALLAICGGGIAGSLALRVASLMHSLDYNFINRNTLCRADALLAGAALALLMRSRYAEWLVRRAWPVALLGVAAALLVVLSGPEGNGPYTADRAVLQMAFSFTLVALCSVAIVAAALRHDSLTRRAFEWKYLRFFGKYSYGLYVLHALPLPAMVLLLGPLRQHGISTVASRLGVALFTFVLSVAAAYVVFQGYEKRFLRLKRYFDYAPQTSQ